MNEFKLATYKYLVILLKTVVNIILSIDYEISKVFYFYSIQKLYVIHIQYTQEFEFISSYFFKYLLFFI